MSDLWVFNIDSPLAAYSAGLQISRGDGRHADRAMPCFDLLFVREGTLPIQEEHQAFDVRAGQTLILWPRRHHWGTANFSPDMRLYWLHFDLECQSFPAESVPVDRNQVILPQYSTVERPDILESLFRRYLDDQEGNRLLPHYASALTRLMLYEIADHRQQDKTDRNAAALANRALTYIRSHLNEPLSVAKIAAELGYHPDYLNRIFERTYRHSLTKEIHLSRIGYARYLLLHSHCNIAEIALRCGFKEVNYFSRLFKRYEGVTATEFRQMNARANINYE